MTKVIGIRGPALSHSGYGYHSRQYAHWARDIASRSLEYDAKFELYSWGSTTWMISSENEYDCKLIDYIMKNSVQSVKGADLTVQIQLPHEWDPALGKINIGVTAGVETDKVSQEWISCCLAMDYVVVPSQFSKQSFVNSAEDDYDRKRLEKRLIVINEPIHPEFLRSLVNEDHVSSYQDQVTPLLESLPSNSFLLFGQITGNNSDKDRKNTFNAIKWFVEEFANEEIGLVVKTNLGRSTAFDRHQTTNLLQSTVEQVKALYSVSDMKVKVYMLHGNLTEFEKAKLYTSSKIKALFSPTRGEGYGLPIQEAVAAGCPVIATNFSGHLDFAANAIEGLKFELKDVHESKVDNKIFVKGARWAEVDSIMAKYALRKVLNEVYYKEFQDRCNKEAQIIRSTHNIESLNEAINSAFKPALRRI